jgi:hypothetical protein
MPAFDKVVPGLRRMPIPLERAAPATGIPYASKASSISDDERADFEPPVEFLTLRRALGRHILDFLHESLGV